MNNRYAVQRKSFVVIVLGIRVSSGKRIARIALLKSLNKDRPHDKTSWRADYLENLHVYFSFMPVFDVSPWAAQKGFLCKVLIRKRDTIDKRTLQTLGRYQIHVVEGFSTGMLELTWLLTQKVFISSFRPSHPILTLLYSDFNSMLPKDTDQL